MPHGLKAPSALLPKLGVDLVRSGGPSRKPCFEKGYEGWLPSFSSIEGRLRILPNGKGYCGFFQNAKENMQGLLGRPQRQESWLSFSEVRRSPFFSFSDSPLTNFPINPPPLYSQLPFFFVRWRYATPSLVRGRIRAFFGCDDGQEKPALPLPPTLVYS